MAKNRIQTLKPPCGYAVSGIDEIYLLDKEDFKGLRFAGGKNYDSCNVDAIIRTSEFVPLFTGNSSKYNAPQTGKIYTHTVVSFIPELSAELSEQLNLSIKRRYAVLLKFADGSYYFFGYDGGAVVSYESMTEGGIGTIVTISCRSIYPLFAVSSYETDKIITYNPDFISGLICV